MKHDDETISFYLNDIKNIPLLTQDEEKKLAEEAVKGSLEAKNKLVKSNLRFVITIAKSYQGRGLELSDLISEGNLGLMTAVDHFDVSKGYRFISYAVWWIRQSIQKALCDKSRAIRLPMNKVSELAQVQKAKAIVGSDKAEAQQISEMAAILSMSEEKVRDMLKLDKDIISLDAPIDNDAKDSDSFGAGFKDEINAGPEERAIESAMKSDVASAVNTLKPTAQKVLRMRYGLNGLKPMSLSEVGAVVGLTKERIRQIEKGAIQTLQLPSKKRRLEAYVA
ncbi:MAG: RNA polymerase sigma factor RpoD/SigA [Treponema sp.]|nr:RNA polymerase sigma factor RpoD/SigA [Treponema sp.]